MESMDPVAANIDANNTPSVFFNILAQLLGFAPRLPEGVTSVVHHGPFHGRETDDGEVAIA